MKFMYSKKRVLSVFLSVLTVITCLLYTSDAADE